MSKEQNVSAAILERLSGIRVANGFNTDIGQKVFSGKLQINPEDLPCCTLVHGDDEPDPAKDPGVIRFNQRALFGLEAHDSCDPDNPNVRALEMIADIKRAIFDPAHLLLDRAVSHLEYVGRQIQPRAAGVRSVVVSVDIRCGWKEDLADP